MTLDHNMLVRLLAPLSALLRDVKAIVGYEHDIPELENRIRTLVLSRGPGVLLLDFPSMGASLDKWLSRGWFDLDSEELLANGPYGSVSRGTHLFQFLLDELFTGSETMSRVDSNAVLALRQIFYFWKKVKIECPEVSIRAAVDQFVDVDVSLREPSGSWNADVLFLGSVSFSSDAEANEQPIEVRWALNWMDKVFPYLIPKVECLAEDIVPRHGPGAVADIPGGVDKYYFPNWPSKLEGFFPEAQFSVSSEEIFSLDQSELRSRKESAARLLAVPKTFKGPRLISAEPTAHQYTQQGVLEWMRRHMRPLMSCMYTPESQFGNRESSLELSLHPDLGATVDLSEASDRLSLWAVERAFRSNESLLRALHACRTRTIVDGTGMRPELSMRLRKYAGMGNATTFPIQSIFYAGVALSVILAHEYGAPGKGAARLIKRWSGSVRVFGDDIIFRRPQALMLLASVFDYLQLKINWNKTHYGDGYFRESCGMDAYEGMEVTPIYLRAVEPGKGASLASWVAVSNNAHENGWWNLAAWMVDQVPTKVLGLIPVSSEVQPCICLYTFCEGTQPPLGRQRYDGDIQQRLYRVLYPKARSRKVWRSGTSRLLSYFLEKPDPLVAWDSDALDVRAVTIKSGCVTLRW
jgi:hypothetical protein